MRVTSVYPLVLPNVEVSFEVPNEPLALDGYGRFRRASFPRVSEEQIAWLESTEQRLAERDWQRLRVELTNLDVSNASSVAEWLNAAGYVPSIAAPTDQFVEGVNWVHVPERLLRGRGFVNADFGSGSGWKEEPGDTPRLCRIYEEHRWVEEYVTPEIRAWLSNRRVVIRFLMGMDRSTFVDAVQKAAVYFTDQQAAWNKVAQDRVSSPRRPLRRSSDPETKFRRQVGAPANCDLRTLEQFLRGIGGFAHLPASFSWNETARPFVTVEAHTPMDAIILSIHIDKNFSARRWITCSNCGRGFEQTKSHDRFCPTGKCKDAWHNKRRSLQKEAVREAEQNWLELLVARRTKLNRATWIVDQATDAMKTKYPKWFEPEITGAWAKQELQKLQRRSE